MCGSELLGCSGYTLAISLYCGQFLKISASKHDTESTTMSYKMEMPAKVEATGSIFQINEKAWMRRIDYIIVPLMFLCYLTQFLDKVLINVSLFKPL